MSDDVWEPLVRELDRWRQAGRKARFWLRDDDAIEPTEALEKLIAVTKAKAIPLALAVIPAQTGEPLAKRLSGEVLVSVAVHGWSHHNHARPDGKKQELGCQRLMETVLGELYRGELMLRQLHPDRFVPLLVPPWNRIDKALLPMLPALGFQALSVYGRAKAGSPLKLVNTHVDIIDWHGTRGGRPAADLVGELLVELDDRFAGNQEPVGVLAHHLVHDASAWDFLTELFALTGDHPAAAWTSAPALLRLRAR